MPLSEAVHSLWVLLTNASFGVLVWEGIQRRSAFYTILFLALGSLSFALHCEETGICAPLSTTGMARLQIADLGLSYFLFNVMMLVVLEVRMEVTGRLLAGAAAILFVARNAFDIKFNVTVSLILGAALLAVDANVNKRRFRPAWWRRLALIGGMAAAGALLFKLLKSLWAVHGLWHIYYVTCCYLILLAERYKKTLQGTGKARAVGQKQDAPAAAAGSGAAYGISTPMKRRDSGAAADAGVSIV